MAERAQPCAPHRTRGSVRRARQAALHPRPRDGLARTLPHAEAAARSRPLAGSSSGPVPSPPAARRDRDNPIPRIGAAALLGDVGRPRVRRPSRDRAGPDRTTRQGAAIFCSRPKGGICSMPRTTCCAARVRTKKFIQDAHTAPPLKHAGESALAELTDLSPPPLPAFAVAARDWRIVAQTHELVETDRDQASHIVETWSYDPAALSTAHTVDPLSLYAQFHDHRDERVSMAAETTFGRNAVVTEIDKFREHFALGPADQLCPRSLGADPAAHELGPLGSRVRKRPNTATNGKQTTSWPRLRRRCHDDEVLPADLPPASS